MNLDGRQVILHDMCLRDGMHAKRHQISLDEMVTIARGLDQAGVPFIEVTHGDGLGGAYFFFSFAAPPPGATALTRTARRDFLRAALLRWRTPLTAARSISL